jgi:hypothetical protein
MPFTVLNSSKHASCRHHFLVRHLRTIDLISTITMIILFSFGRIINTSGEDSWGQGVHNRRRSSFDVDNVLLTHLLFFIRVIEDDDVAITERPKKPTGEVVEEFPSEFLIP